MKAIEINKLADVTGGNGITTSSLIPREPGTTPKIGKLIPIFPPIKPPLQIM